MRLMGLLALLRPASALAGHRRRPSFEVGCLNELGALRRSGTGQGLLTALTGITALPSTLGH